MADKTNPSANPSKTSEFLPRFYRSDSNKKFLQATLDQLVQPGTVDKINGFVGRQNSKATKHDDIFVKAPTAPRQNYQLEPGITVTDKLGNNSFFKDYQDYINQLDVFGANVSNHASVNKQEFYSWDPHINWDKFVNFQQYYWLPYGPDVVKIKGQQLDITSTFTVRIEAELDNNEYVVTPDGLTRNPTIKLYKGQTYHFEIDSFGNPFSIKTSRTFGKTDLYKKGITNNEVEVGTLTFEVPFDCPNVLYYISETDIDLGGVIEVADIDENSFIDVETDLIGKKTYTLPDGTALSNGMKVSFIGNVTPTKYATGQYYVEGVGEYITLVDESILELVSAYTTAESVLFDDTPFDSLPFSDATSYAKDPDYVVINRGSLDHNPWSRYNRWFHKDVIEASASFNKKIPSLDQSARAVRPIIEFDANLKLFNFGRTAIIDVDLIDSYTTDVFSNIEGSFGYNIDGVPVAQGQRILFTADTDPLVKNKIYKVQFIDVLQTTINGASSRQIHLIEENTPVESEVVLVKQGTKNQGLMYWYNGDSWVKAQQKTYRNQPPLFDVVDDNGTSYGNTDTYEGSSFAGTSLFEYKVGSGTTDSVLGFPLSYKNISNIGDIVFNFTLTTDIFTYKEVAEIIKKPIIAGHLIKTTNTATIEYVNGWQISNVTNTQACVRIYKNSGKTNNFDIDVYDDITSLSDLEVKIYINGNRVDPSLWSLVDGLDYKYVVFNTDILLTDIVTIRSFAKQAINSNGYYEIPINLQNNPLNQALESFTLGEVIDHVSSIVDNTPGFVGQYPGPNNLKDLGNVTKHGTKFVQHSGPLSLSLYHITSEGNNVIRAIETAQDDYNKFKKSFISVAETLGVDADPIVHVNEILKEITKNKQKTAPYYFSDMVGFNAYLLTNFTVLDYRIKKYPLTDNFTLEYLSNKAVYVYLNNRQLKHGKEYVFDGLGFIEILTPLTADDTISLYEYDSTDGCFIPQTPTKLGMWPKYEPMLYLDTSLVTPRWMIQGHDGSQVLAYGTYDASGTPDFRDALILELETRIFNTIKVKYNTDIFDIHTVIPSYSRTTDYTLDEFNAVLAPQFYRWTSLIDKDFSKPLSYDHTNSMTFNYSGQAAPDGRPVPGYWRGIYRWLLDTDRPNVCPWEMLGFFEEPSWWQDVYGPAPYTSDNLILWKDLTDGIVREPGKPATKLEKYARPFLENRCPVDGQGKLISPLLAGLTTGVITQATGADYVFGDVSPIEGAWRRSSHYPFAVLLSMMMLQPAKVFGTLLDRSRVIRNITGQLVYKDTGLRIAPKDIVFPSVYSSTTRVHTAGLLNYLVDYIIADNLKSLSGYQYDMQYLNSQLTYRIAGFTSKEKFNLLLDSKSPTSTSSVFVPQEDYDIILNVSSPIKKITYSGVVITKFEDGFDIKGYSKVQPYFVYYPWVQEGRLQNVGGISESYSLWTQGEQYAAGKVVSYNNRYYRVKALHVATSFDASKYQALPSLPIVGGRDAFFRSAWDRTEEIKVPYGTKFRTIQEVVDFLLGHGEWLKDQGFIFDEFNTTLSKVANWETSAKEFMFWTTQNWSTGQDKWKEWEANTAVAYGEILRYNGDYYRAIRNVEASTIFDEEDNYVRLDGLSTVGSSVISLSPGATKVTFSAPNSVVDDIVNPFNGYEMFRVDGTPIPPDFLNSYRGDGAVSYTPIGEESIFGATFYLVQKEQVVIIKNSTMFNDTIYNTASGYKQDRIKIAGYVTSDWNGGFDSPGFVFDQANINEWSAWTDYALGDIVKHKEFYYSAKSFTAGTEKFVSDNWYKLEQKPTPKLLPNWTYKASQFEDFYSLDSDNFDAGQQKMAQHLIGYQKRQYLENIIKDDVSEFKFFQGMIIEKGTTNVLNKLFDVLSSTSQDSVDFFEEWALRVGQYGASDAFETIEFVLDEAQFKGNPQGFELVSAIDNTKVDFIYRQTPNDIYLKPLGYNNNPWPIISEYQPYLRTPGYVRASDVKLVVSSIDDVVNHPNTGFVNGDYVWCGFEGPSWNVYRYTTEPIKVLAIAYDKPSKELTVTAHDLVTFTAGTYIAISQTYFNKFYKVKSVDLNTFVLDADISNWVEPFTDEKSILFFTLHSQRTSSIDNANDILPSIIKEGELLWTDNDGTGKWATWEYKSGYTFTNLTNAVPTEGLGYGRSISINHKGTVIVISSTTGQLIVYDKVQSPNAPWLRRQFIDKPMVAQDGSFGSNPNSPSLIGEVLATSADGSWMAIGSPRAGYASTTYCGDYVTSAYSVNSIVKHLGSYWKATMAVVSGNAPSATSQYWDKIRYIPIDEAGTNSSLAAQGAVSLYLKDKNNIYTLLDTIVSPNPTATENFGSSLTFANNKLFIGAEGHNSSAGIVYQMEYSTVVEATAYYNPNGSSGNTLVVSNTDGIKTGMAIRGEGFTTGQLVGTVVDSTTLIISAAPDTQPSGIIEFTTTGWGYSENHLEITSPLTTPSKFGDSISVSTSTNRLLISAPNSSDYGRVFVYDLLADNTYEVIQTLLGDEKLFGQSIAMSDSGKYMAISSILSDGSRIDQGKVFVYEFDGTSYTQYQTLVSRTPEIAEYFGTNITFLNDYDTLVVYSKNADSLFGETFDNGTTVFDNNVTTFQTRRVDSGVIDVFDRYNSKWILSETLVNPLGAGSGYGTGLAIAGDHIVVGAPYAMDNGVMSGKVYEYRRQPTRKSWNKVRQELAKPDLSKIKRVFLYNKETNKEVAYLDVIDPMQGKIAGIAEQEIKFKTFYDPAIYSVGTDAVNVDDGIAWNKKHVGMLWWDLRTAKFLDSYDTELIYRNNTWNTLFPDASIDIYEWVESSLTPDAWNAQADTEEGLTNGISGTTLYGSTVYSLTRRYDNVSKTYKNTYYYWVKNKKTVPTVQGRRISSEDVANLILNPRGQGHKYLAITGSNSFSLVNVKPLLEDSNVVLSVEYWLTENSVTQNIHSEWKLISNNESSSIPPAIEQKWIDSLCGKDSAGRVVPDSALPPKLKYGIENRPRQGMFVNRFEALKQYVESVNLVLQKYQITDSRDLTKLELYDVEPMETTGLYDDVFDTDAELRFANVGSFLVPTLTPVITDGAITSVSIDEPGRGYLKAPYITVHGAGEGAILRTKINTKGQVTGVTIIAGGKGYTSATTLSLRNYSTLVHSDSQAGGAWSIYTYEPSTQVWSRAHSQSYDTRKYWSYTDWYATGYTQFTSPDYSVTSFVDLNTVSPEIGKTVKVRTTVSGNWVLLEKYASVDSVDWTQQYKVVGSQNGTIQLNSSLYEFTDTVYGYDGSLYDGGVFDNVATQELRNILTAVKEDICIDDLRSEYLNLFFTSVRYALSEQNYLDWVFKTSFVKAQHNVGELYQSITYNNDNLHNYEDFINEVKPYRTKVREYVSSYNAVDTGKLSMTDFDLMPVYNNGRVESVTALVINDQIQEKSEFISQYPWQHWNDNVGFVVTELRLIDSGEGYISAPNVTIVGKSGSGATAKAFISSGKVNRVVLITKGSGYLSAPSVILDGGLGGTGTPARVVAVIGDGVIRSNLIKIKFDRITQNYFITQLEETETFVGSGSRLQWPLVWAPDSRLGTSSVAVNGVEMLRDSYKLMSVKSTSKGYTSYAGSILFTDPIAKDAVVTVTYIKDWALLNAADRVQYYYNPTSGELGKDLAQLMTGVDYGGVIVSGMDFASSGGWASLPYYSDKWDSSDSTFDDYIVTVAANQQVYTLPYVPTANTELNVYRITLNRDNTPTDDNLTTYMFNVYDLSPKVEVIRTVDVLGLTKTYVQTGSTGRTLKVNNTAGIEQGMVIIGLGYESSQTVETVVDGTTITTSAIPNETPGGALFFTKNIAGVSILHVESTTGINQGDVITSNLTGAFGYGTVVSEIIDNTKIRLSQILFKDCPASTTVTFTRQLVVPTDCTIYGNGTVELTQPIPSGATLSVYSPLKPVRIDDGTIIMDGTSRTVDITDFGVTVNQGDQIIIRKSTSDGSIKPQESDYDTAITGGDLAYSSATGLQADDIILDGDGFVTPTSSPATEEVVPGQVVDAVAIKVFDRPFSNSSKISIDNYKTDGVTTEFTISQTPNSKQAVIVKISNSSVTDNVVTKTSEILYEQDDYTVDYRNNKVVFHTAPVDHSMITIISFGFAGANVLDLDYFIADGATSEFITQAPWITNLNGIVYVDGIETPVEYFETDDTYESALRVGLRFSIVPPADSIINYVIVSGLDHGFSTVKTERLSIDNRVSRKYNLANNYGDALPIESNIIVKVGNGTDFSLLNGPNNSYYTISSNRLTYTVDYKKFQPYNVDITDIVVYANGEVLKSGVEYTVDLGGISVKINRATYKKYSGKTLVISITTDNGYVFASSYTTVDSNSNITVHPATITLKQAYTVGDVLEVTSFYKHDILDIQRTAVSVTTNLSITPDTVEYYEYLGLSSGRFKLDRQVLDEAYIMVVQNGKLLLPSIDFKLNEDRQSITFATAPATDDKISLITFSSNVSNNNIAYMQFKDMLNRTHFKRLNANKQTELSQDLMYTDTAIHLLDGTNFDVPNPAKNKPGIIEIQGERIEYFKKDGNILSQLRRGTLGTGIPRMHPQTAKVQDIGPSETLPYLETTVIDQVTSTGTNSLALSFVPTKSDASWSYDTGFVSSIPTSYGQGDDIEVFVGGYDTSVIWASGVDYTAGTIVNVGSYTYRCITSHTSGSVFNNDSSNWQFFIGNIRLRKEPYKVHNINQAPNSPEGDLQLDADFAVDGASKALRLTTPLAFGTKVTVVKRTGVEWDQSINIQVDDSKIGKFLRAEPGIWYSAPKKSETNVSSSFDATGTTLDNDNITFDRG